MLPKQKGNIGEEYVAAYLKENGCRILERNYTIRGAEIDIIALCHDYLLFVEVKSRKAGTLISPAEWVDIHKQRRIIMAAKTYISKIDLTAQPRFDVAEVYLLNGRPEKLNYIKNAFCEEW